MTSIEGTYHRRRDTTQWTVVVLAVSLVTGVPVLAHHTTPHQEAVQAARSALFDRKDPSMTLRLLEGMWANQPTDSETPYLLGLAHFLLYDPDKALLMFDMCLSLDGRTPISPQQRLDCLYWSGRAHALKAALAWYRRTSLLDGVIKSRRAVMVALDVYEQVLAQAPDHTGALLGQAEYYMAAPYLPPLAYGDLEKARALVARALALDRDNPPRPLSPGAVGFVLQRTARPGAERIRQG